MILIASNLGQIIGRAVYGELERGPASHLDMIPIIGAPRFPAGHHRRAQIATIIAANGSIGVRDAARVFGVDVSHAATLLGQMVASGFLLRDRPRGSYRYRLMDQKATA